MMHPLPTVAPDTERLRADAANFMQHNTDDQCRRMCRVGVDDLAVLLAWVAQFPTRASQQAAVSPGEQPGTSALASEPKDPPAPQGEDGWSAEVREGIARICGGSTVENMGTHPFEGDAADLDWSSWQFADAILKLIAAARSLPDSLATMEKVDG